MDTENYDGYHPCPDCDGKPKQLSKALPPDFCWTCMNTGKIDWIDVVMGGSLWNRSIKDTLKNMDFIPAGLKNKMSGNIPKGNYAASTNHKVTNMKYNNDGTISVDIEVQPTVPVNWVTIDTIIKKDKT